MELSVLTFVLHAMLCGVCVGINLDVDLQKLSEMLPGLYSTNPRHSKDLRHRFYRLTENSPAEALTTMSVSALYRPVDVTFLPECFNVYVEQKLYSENKPHRQWLYSFSKNEASRSIVLKVYTFTDPSIAEKIQRNPLSMTYISQKDVTTRSDCDMNWRRLGEKFIGTTSRKCIAVVKDRQVRISVSTTLTPSGLQIDEGWYNLDDGSRLVELEQPIVMTKVTSDTDTTLSAVAESAELENPVPVEGDVSSLQKDGRIRRHKTDHRNSISETKRQVTNDLKYQKKPESLSNKLPESEPKHEFDNKYAAKEKEFLTSIIKKAGFKDLETTESVKINSNSYPGSRSEGLRPPQAEKQKTTWNLQTYSGLVDALLNGHKVYFTAKTKRCFHSNMPVRERTTIGDYVNVYEIEKDLAEKQPYMYITFSMRGLQHSNYGFLDVVREVTVHRNNTVHIATAFLNDENQLTSYSMAVCKLFNQDTGKGDVRFYLDPYRDVVPVKNFRKLRGALQKGKMIRLTTEYDKCSGRNDDRSLIVGGELRSYDLGRNGKTMDAALKRFSVSHSLEGASSVEEHHHLYQFFKRGETVVIENSKLVASDRNHGAIVRGFQKYKCELDPNSSTKAISLFNS